VPDRGVPICPRDARIAAQTKINELQAKRSALIDDPDIDVAEVFKVDAEISRLAGQIDIFAQREAACLQKHIRLQQLRAIQARDAGIIEAKKLDTACVEAARTLDRALTDLTTAVAAFIAANDQRRSKWPATVSRLGLLAHFNLETLIPDGVRSVAERDALNLADTVKARLAEGIELVAAQVGR
jgi:hypothetical protein